MSNGARHAFGVVAGLLLPPLALAGLLYGIGEISFQTRSAFQFPWYAVGVLAVAAVVLAFLAGSRLSPVASLLGGLAYTALGLLPLLEFTGGPRLVLEGLVPARVNEGYLALGHSGALLVVGVMLLTVSLFPSRWRATVPEPLSVSPAYGQGTSPYLPEDATRPMFRE
ncbi:hypothetical protein [Nonomuraea wenchangensis]|uniref:Uncharacterized protein n=1 Tax=Nonomuraea wenchangensis TaxID=568860 RepID=A0A1I0JAK3_9ACTN|nr:hypothetical protein [Nonomuraea wenchangensis]SEU06158.1 hypothetical protein SAMN05421811_105520 [Nonomuraea wenchangensis]